MKNIKQELLVWIQLIAFIVIWAIILYISKIEYRISWEAIKKLPEVVTVYIILHFIFNKWLWRMPQFQGWLVIFPDLQGTWQGKLKTTWSDPSTKTTPSPIPVILVIKQSFISISCVMYTQESTSYSNAALLIEDENSGVKKIIYTYINRPRVIVRDRSVVHDGTVILRIITTPERSLQGEYWTNRRTAGDISLTFRSKKLLESFPDDLKQR